MIRDKNIEYKYKTEFFPVTSFNSFIGTAASQSMAGNLLEAGGDNGYSALEMNNNDDIARLVMPIPSHWDTANDMFFRVLYVHELGPSAVNYAVLFKQSAFGAAISGAESGGTLDTVIPSDTSTGSDALDATAWGTMNGGTLLSTNDVVCFDINSANGTAVVTQLVGFEVAYLPKLTVGPQVNNQADPTDA